MFVCVERITYITSRGTEINSDIRSIELIQFPHHQIAPNESKPKSHSVTSFGLLITCGKDNNFFQLVSNNLTDILFYGVFIILCFTS